MGSGLIPGPFVWGLWCTKWHQERFFSEYFGFPCQYHFTHAPYSSSSACWSYHKGKRAKHRNLSKSNTLSEIRDHWAKKVLSLCLVFKELICCFFERPSPCSASVRSTIAFSQSSDFNLGAVHICTYYVNAFRVHGCWIRIPMKIMKIMSLSI